MMKALYSGVAGLKTHQTKMDVIGNNISNVNTAAYKAQRASFADVYYSKANIGYGAKVSSVDTMYSLAGYSPTDSSTDLYISGDGYFTVENVNGDRFLTRNGCFEFDTDGYLRDQSGSYVLGTNGAVTVSSTLVPGTDRVKIDLANYTNIGINEDGTIVGTDSADTIHILGLVGLATVPNQGGLVLEGNSYYSKSKDSGEPTYTCAGYKGTGAILTNALEMSNVDLATQFTDMITTQRGYQANSKIITVSDELLETLVNLKR